MCIILIKWINEVKSKLKMCTQVRISGVTSQQCCGELGTLRFRCQWGGSATLWAPTSRPANPPRRGRHAGLSGEKPQGQKHCWIRELQCLFGFFSVYYFLYLHWHPGDQFSSQNPGTLSWPTTSAGHQSWVWCWSGWPEGSPPRRWCSNHWHCEGCSPRSERKDVEKGCVPRHSCVHTDSSFALHMTVTRVHLKGESAEVHHPTSPRCESPSGPLVSGFTMMTLTPGRICTDTNSSQRMNINTTGTCIEPAGKHKHLLTLPDSIRGRLWGAPLSTSLTLQNTLWCLQSKSFWFRCSKYRFKAHWNTNTSLVVAQ